MYKRQALRCAGFNNVDLDAAAAAGITVVRVPAYSPYAVAEYTVALMLSLIHISLLNAVITPAGISCAISNERERSKVAIPTSTRFFINTSF